MNTDTTARRVSQVGLFPLKKKSTARAFERKGHRSLLQLIEGSMQAQHYKLRLWNVFMQ